MIGTGTLSKQRAVIGATALALVAAGATAATAQAARPGASYGSFSATSSGSGSPFSIVNVSPPSISGNPVVGSTLAASPGTWSGPVLLYSYQWQRCDTSGNGCSSIGGAVATTYRPTGADVGRTLRVLVQASSPKTASRAISPPTAVVQGTSTPSTSPPASSGTGTGSTSSSGSSSGGSSSGSSSGSVSERFLDFTSGFGSATVQTSGPGEQVSVQAAFGLPPCRVVAGGYSSGTHYARVRWQDVEYRLGADFWMSADFYLPSDFYTRQESYMRLITLDNYNLDPSNTWRIGFLLYGGDHLPRLMRQRQGIEETEIVKLGQLLPTGRTFQVAIHLRLSQASGQALSEIYIDGNLVGSSTVANVPVGTLPDRSAPRFTRVGFGIDGAGNQSTKTVELRMGRIGVTTNPFA